MQINYSFIIIAYMLRRFNYHSLLYRFANLNNQTKINNKNRVDQPKQLQKTSYGSLRDIVEEKKRMSIQGRRKYEESLPAMEMRMFANEHLCDVKLYMKHDDWKSQYIYALLNYQKLGFQRLSDYMQLREASKFYGLSKKPELDKWPLLKFNIPLRQPNVLHGINQIIKFLNQHQFFRFQVDDDAALAQTLQKYINQNVTPELQSLFWHPRLTLQQVFHTNITGYTKASLNYRMISVIYRNIMEITKQITKNFIKIMFNRQKYANSKQKLQKSLRQITSMLQGKQFIGGTKPSHLDFYLYAILSTKRSSKHFEQFLKKEVSPQFWSWMLRMRRLTQYDRQRVTLY